MKNFYTEYLLKNWWFHAFSIISVCLIIASFIVPPTGVIDSSVLAATGELFAFASLGTVIKAIDNGTTAKLKKKDIEIEVAKNNHNDSIDI